MPRVKVSQKNIDDGVKHDSRHCMIADAIRDSVPGALRPAVDLQSIRWSTEDKNGNIWRHIYFTPPVAQRSLLKFDDGVKPRPFTIGLARTAQKIKTRTKDQRTGKKKRAKTQPKRMKTNSPNVPGRRAPTVEGGKPPPRGQLPNTGGHMRRFGLKGMGRVD